jgi:S1-C subfamily serine protease
LPSSDTGADLGFAITNEALKMVAEQVPELADLFPLRNKFNGRAYLASDWVAVVVEYGHGPGIPHIGSLQPPERDAFERLAPSHAGSDHASLRAALEPAAFSHSKFSYLGPASDGKVCWPHLAAHVVEWLNRDVLPLVLQRNRDRILRAIPTPPQFNFDAIARAMWVLECEESATQGTAFALNTVGTVTCQHVLGPATKAFRATSLSARHAVNVLATEVAIDLAVLAIDAPASPVLEPGSADSLRLMDHIAVAGYPNYRLGDTGTLVPGLVIGFRTISGIRRILTNAPIIAGVSGGPVVDSSNKVIGIAVTGADKMEDSPEAEHSIVPVDALRFLRR